ncbi:hypothetical protein FD754_000404 [Muntiacus muntjak]|uniref:DUF1736 domain-containing protein n=1 Tax=Muntiacus muntjak TaxID=9888 RepID=A0A5N3W5D7_MUNMU|nr:hypothetical protein FD754_000404 [Muntiacus muntjak]
MSSEAFQLGMVSALLPFPLPLRNLNLVNLAKFLFELKDLVIPLSLFVTASVDGSLQKQMLNLSHLFFRKSENPLCIFVRKNLSLFLSISLLTFWGTSLLGARLYWMGNKPPSFSNSDNPAADSDSLLARTLTFFYLPTKNLWLLLCPDTLSFDWSMDAVPLLKTISDWRNLHTVAFYTGLLLLAYYGLKSPSLGRECNGKSVTNGKQNANGHSCHSEVEYGNSEIKPSFASKVENGIRNNASQRTQLPSTENIVVLSLSLLIIPFVPATNLFFYVGFVIAERVLYIPSMGFCLLITVGARALYVKVQKRFLKSLIFYATAALIVFYGLKTAIRNGDWQNEEMLYRSGIKVNPAKVDSNSIFSKALPSIRSYLYLLFLFSTLHPFHQQIPSVLSHFHTGALQVCRLNVGEGLCPLFW